VGGTKSCASLYGSEDKRVALPGPCPCPFVSRSSQTSTRFEIVVLIDNAEMLRRSKTSCIASYVAIAASCVQSTLLNITSKTTMTLVSQRGQSLVSVSIKTRSRHGDGPSKLRYKVSMWFRVEKGEKINFGHDAPWWREHKSNTDTTMPSVHEIFPRKTMRASFLFLEQTTELD
jgi:hypothetical protein